MRALAAVFAREIFARRLVFPVALAAGLMPILVSLANGWSKPNAAELRLLGALVVAATFSFAFALLIGGSVIAGETSEKRISFFFSRPLPAGAIWGGKLLAVLVLTLVPGVIALVPALLFAPSTRTRDLFGFEAIPWQAALATLLVAFFFILGAHAVVTIARLRSPWVALDLLLAPALVLLAAVFLRSLVRDGLFALNLGKFDLTWLATGLLAAVLAALAAASYAQVAAGRTDARRAHGAFSVVLWGILGIATAAFGGYAWWVASARATDLALIEGWVLAAPQGSWVAAGGSLRAGRGSGMFLYDAASRRSIRLRSGDATFSRDGTRAAWGQPRFGFFERKESRSDILVADVASRRPVETGLECSSGWCRVFLSPSGRRLALAGERSVTAYDVSNPENPKELAAFHVDGDVTGIAFVDEDTLRLFPRILNAARQKNLGPTHVVELSLSSKKSLVTGVFDREAAPYLRLSPDARFLVGTRRLTEDSFPSQVLTLHDGHTGALVTTLAEGLRNPQALFLTGNRIAVAGIAGAQARLLFFEGDRAWGPPTRSVELGRSKRVVLGREIAPGKVALSLLPFEEDLPASARGAKLVIVDAATGAVAHGPDGLVPVDRFGWWWNPVLPPAEAGTPASSLFLDAEQRLVRLDPATGAQTVLLGRSK
jgi:ABC-type transport system involved in multi-copper enzyme maturation permease subunit